MKLLVSLFYFFSITFTPLAQAAKAPSVHKKDLKLVNTRWIHSPYVESKNQTQTLGQKSLIRYMKLGESLIPVAQMTMTTNSSVNDKNYLEEIKKEWTQTAFPDLKWHAHEDSQSFMLEAYWPKMNKYISLSIYKSDAGYVSFVTFARMGYLSFIFKDLEDIKNALRTSYESHSQKKSTAKVFPLFDLIFKKVYAQTDYTTQLSNLINSSNITIPSNNSSSPSNLNLTGDVNITGGTANTVAITTDANTVETSRNTVITSQNAVTVSQNTVTASANIRDSSQNIKASADKLDSLARDKKNAFEMAAATSAGFVVGALVANMVITGLASGVNYLWNDLLLDRTNNRIRWENFKQAREMIEKTENSSVELEKKLDGLTSAFANFSDNDPDGFAYGDLVDNLEARRDQVLAEAATYKVLAERQDSTADIKACFLKANELERSAHEITKAIQFAKDNKINSENKTEFFCDQLKSYKRMLIDSETSLARLNMMLVAGKNEYFKFREKEIEQIQKDINYINDQNASGGFLDKDKQVTDSIVSIAKEVRNSEKDYFIQQCIAGRSAAGKFVNEAYQRDQKNIASFDSGSSENTYKYFDCLKIYNLAKEKSNKTQSEVNITKLKQKGYEEAERSAQFSSKLHHSVNIDRLQLDLNEKRKWFEKKEIENQCYQLLGEKMPSTQEKSCNQIAPKLMSLYRSHQKAHDLWVNNCQDRYESALNGISNGPDYNAVISQLRRSNP